MQQIAYLSAYFDLSANRSRVLCVIVSALVAFLSLWFFNPILRDADQRHLHNTISMRPKYRIFANSPERKHLCHVEKALERFGIASSEGTPTITWDLMWAFDYPFVDSSLTRLQLHQLVNRFPGIGHLATKSQLTTANISYVPRAFMLPADRVAYQKYALANPDKKYVQKHLWNGQVQLVDAVENTKPTFIQEFVEDPLLVDGFKFDIGVYTAITSLDPLRLYIYKGDALFRYCPERYYPFNASNVNQYVIQKGNQPTWQIPSLKGYFTEQGYGMKDSFDVYIRSTGRDPSVIWEQVEDAIRQVVLAKEPLIVKSLKMYANKHSFFELMRFDLIVDNNMKVFLMEASMSPNLSNPAHQPNWVVYDQVLYNVLRLVGVATDFERDSFSKRQPEVEELLSSISDLATDVDHCASEVCANACAKEMYQLCVPCLDEEDLRNLHDAYREHMNRGAMKRIFPVPAVDSHRIVLTSLSSKNQLMSRWFEAKCRQDTSFCE